ncbi:carbohydrate porin [Pseudomonas sp. G1002]|nr:carbohydrate porin [Pseudomonas sp. G1002]
MELYYGFLVSKWLTARPNIQYVVSPGGVNDVDNAWIAS